VDDEQVAAQQRMWTVGDYPAIARHLLPISVETIAALGVSPGDRVLDVGAGDGNAAIEAATRGAVVTAVDLTPAQVERARARCRAEGVEVDVRVGDATALDIPDASYDLVVSVFGMMFAADHAAATAEMARVCRPGGTVANVAWVVDGWAVTWRERAARILPAQSGSPTPDDWGDRDEAVRRMRAAGLDAHAEVRPFAWRFPSVEDAADFFLSAGGPFIMFVEAATAAGTGDKVRGELIAAMEEGNVATDGTAVLPQPYLLAIGTR
jgi:SAM-dependent methyltransferase